MSEVLRRLTKAEEERNRFRYILFTGMKGQLRELIVIRLPHAYREGKELDTLAKASQKEMQGCKPTQWDHVVYLGGANNICWSGTVALQHLPPTPNVYLVARGDIGGQLPTVHPQQNS